MPELPEVESTLRALQPRLVGARIEGVDVRQPLLRWPVSPEVAVRLPGQRITRLTRRAKYLIIHAEYGSVLVHLGMSGSLRLLPRFAAPDRHDHLDLVFEDDRRLRLRDPRRFGSVLWGGQDPLRHQLLCDLGPEPLEAAFDGDWLYRRSQNRPGAVKNFIMNSRVVVGIGNIYASETLHLAGIHPARPARRISSARYARLAESIKQVLSQAISAGGSTLRDYVGAHGDAGEYAEALAVYARAGEPCHQCGASIRSRVIGQRASFFCVQCQT